MTFERAGRCKDGEVASVDGSVAPGKRTRSELRDVAPAAGGAPQLAVQRREGGADPFWFAGGDVPAIAAEGVRGAGQTLPHLDQIQASFGAHDVSHVQAHVGGAAADAADAIGARAYATGDQVAFASAPDLHTAAHEAAHVVQQQAGVQLAGGVGEAGDPYEQHADAVADAVVRGESASSLLGAFAGGGGSRAAVQRDDKPDAPKKKRLGDQPYLVEGDAANPRLYVSADWLIKGGVPRGHTGWIKVAEYPTALRPLILDLARLYPWVEGRADRPLDHIGEFGFEVTSDVWKDGEQQLGVNRNVFLTFGLPEAKPIQAFPTNEGIEIYVDSIYAMPEDKDPAKTEAARKLLARQAVDAVEQLIGTSIIAGLRPNYERQVDSVLDGQKTTTVRHVTSTHDDLKAIFGEQVVEEFAGKTPAGEEGGGAVIHVAGLGNLLILANSEEEKKLVLELLKKYFGSATEAPAGTKGDEIINFQDIDALFKLEKDPRKDELLAILEEMRKGAKPGEEKKWNSAHLRDLIANAREQLEMRDADKLLGKKSDPVVGDNDGILPYPVPGELVNLSGEVQLGMRAEFEFRSTGTTDPREWHFGDPFFFHVDEVNVEWFAVEVDAAGNALGAPEGHEIVDYIEIRDDSWRNDKRFEHKFTKAGRYQVHAYVVHSKWQPAHFKTEVEVVTEDERLRRMEHQTSETWGTEVTREDKVFRGVDDNRDPFERGQGEDQQLEHDKNAHKYAKGTRAEGKLAEEVAGSPHAGMWNERERLDQEIAELEALEDRYRGDDSRSEAMRDHVRERRERLESALSRVETAHFDGTLQPVNIQAHYASRTHGVKTGTLNVVGFFKYEDNLYKGTLLDNSEVVRAENFRFTREDASFEKMMEKLFDDLTLSYPDGSISFAFQVYENPTTPTDRFVRYTRKTDTVGKDFNEVAFDDKTRIAVTFLSLILSLFPPTAPLGIALGLIYNGMDVLNTLDEAQRTDTMTTGKIVDAGLLALDILPAIGALSKTTKIGSKAYHLIEATQLAGDVFLLQDGVQHGIQDLRDRLITQLADKHAKLNELRRTNSSSPEVEQLNDEIRGLESEIRSAAGTVFSQVVASQGLQIASQSVVRHIAGDFFSRKHGDADGDDVDGTHPDNDSGGASGTRGSKVYNDGANDMPETTLSTALGKLPRDRPGGKYAHDGGLKGSLTVLTDDGKRHKVDVEYRQEALDPSRGHDGDAGPGSIELIPPPAPGKKWTAIIKISQKLGSKKDVAHVAGHELDEAIEIIRRYNDDPTIDLAKEHEASLMKPGADATAMPSSHDVAAARELDGLFEAARKTREEYQQALAARQDPTGNGGTVSSQVIKSHDYAVQRLQRKLEAMGFAPPTDAASRTELVKKYAKNPDELAAFIEAYRTDPASQLPNQADATKLVLHPPHAEELGKLGIDPAMSQKLLDKGVSGPAMIEVAKHGQDAVALLDQIVDKDLHNATNAVELVKAAAAAGKLPEATAAAAPLSRWSSPNLPIHEILAKLESATPARFDALSWLVGAPDTQRRLKPADAEAMMTSADAQGVGAKVEQLARTGKLRDPRALMTLLGNLQLEYGDRFSIDLAIEYAARGKEVTVEGPKGDVAVHAPTDPADKNKKPDETTIQAKHVTSADPGRVAQNAYDAIGQLRGDGGEPPDAGSERVAVIQIANKDNDLFGKDKAEQIEGLKYNPSDYDSLKQVQPDGTVGWERIEIRTNGKVINIVPGDL